ncbi:carbohydrate-binding module family 1 protein [Sphaerobolus stellatus SS14]|uniref:Carbohydrate-binding module family 1 protein n=1 Tax=Sphaerobolus stellatus (strain SS14) TaxID=990650 RepID=A0A0C9VTJ8_SPHS4|nr:carbohydrate-binding module family 1 protein [Sphaerobolus stellatus SS14]
MFKFITVSILLFAVRTYASSLETRQSCPNIHVFGARETTAPPGYGTAGVVVDLVLNAHPGATSEAINYPACGGQASCGDISYANSAIKGVQAVATAVNSFNTMCPQTQLVLVGYSQGGQIMDDAFCGGGDTNEGLTSTAIPIQASAINMIKAAIFMGDPRHIPGLSYNVGTCEASGFAPRPTGFQCPSAAKIQSYCDAADPYCCNGDDANTHQGYGTEYGQAALTFINSKLSASATTTVAPTGTTTVGTTSPTQSPTGGTAAHWAQCGGIGFTGPTVCAAPYTCQAANAYYSQCL